MIPAPAQGRILCGAVMRLEQIEGALRAHHPGPLPDELHAQAVGALAELRMALSEIVQSLPLEVRFPAPRETQDAAP